MKRIAWSGWVLLLATLSAFGELVWEHSIVEKTASVHDRKLIAVFPFEARGSTTTILSIRTTCGCTTAELPQMTYSDGESGELTVVFDLNGRFGKQKKSVFVQTDDKNNPNQELVFKATIPKLVSLQPRILYWIKGASTYETQEIKLRFEEPGIRVANVSSDQEQLKIENQTSDEGKDVILSFTPIIPEGELPFFRAVIRIELEADIPLRESVYYAYAIIKSGS
jgi:hypothetical protein